MPNPKRKHTRSRRDLRRSSNSKLEAVHTVACSNCGEPRRPHNVCSKCGFYGGKLVAKVKVKKQKSDTKQ
ncbi:MAG: 50S ribosomal protein L32 [Elusimicrobiota bacterium]|jgi:large subunit ribosomal protein L32|nr:50S ribosomal protein L32 [Elusimicrobiota bacterium]